MTARIAYGCRIVAAALVLAGLVLIGTPLAEHTIELLVAGLVFAQLGGAFPTVRPYAARQLETLIDRGEDVVGRLSANLELFEREAHGQHERPDPTTGGPSS